MAHPFLLPEALRPGDRIRLVAPAGIFDRTLFWRGVSWLRQTFRVEFSRDVFARSQFTAGSQALRLGELNAALRCLDTRAVWCVRGGYGCSEIAAAADFGALARAPKWLIGFSDITVLHTELTRRRIASLHAPNVTGLGLGWQPVRDATLRALQQPLAESRVSNLTQFYPGTATGPLVGGNLTLFHEGAALRRLELPEGAIVFLEEVNEAPYHVARSLVALERMGVFDTAGGILIGQLSADRADLDPRFRDIIAQLAERVRLPTLAGIPSGHHLRANLPLVLGSNVHLGRDHVLLNLAR
jgi:muramoyltetrapeptide carboxypeptidase